MKKIISFIIIIITLSCTKNNDEEKNYPACFEEQIQEVLNSPPTSPRYKIEKYMYHGKEVFAMLDNYIGYSVTYIVDENCNEVCKVGGYGGSINTCGDLNDFELIETVWKDQR